MQNIQNKLIGLRVTPAPDETSVAIELFHAAESGELHTVQRLLERQVSLESTDSEGRNALHYAAESGNCELVAYLIDCELDPNTACHDQSTPLHIAAAQADADMIETLIIAGADVAAQNEDGQTPLHIAADTGDVKALATLVDHGAEVNLLDHQGVPPINYALRANVNAAAFLARNGADVNKRDKHGATPLDFALWIAAGSGSEENLCALQGAVAASQLLKLGARITACASSPERALFAAARAGYDGLARDLIQAGVDFHHADRYGRTPLHIAAREGRAAVVRTLLAAGANVAARDHKGHTPLESARRARRAETTSLLLAVGADYQMAHALDLPTLPQTRYEAHRAFKHLALKYHPDKLAYASEAERETAQIRFAAIAEARDYWDARLRE